MPADLKAEVLALLSPIPELRGFLRQPPISWLTAAINWQEDDQSEIGGRYDKAAGALSGAWHPKRQDLYLSTTTGRTGLSFDEVSGDWDDTWVHPEFDVYGLALLNNTPDTEGEVIETTPRPGPLASARFIVRRDLPPAGGTGSHDRVDNYLYLYLAWSGEAGSGIDYRLGMAWESPIHIEYTEDGWNTVHPVKVFQDLGSSQNFLSSNRREIRWSIVVDRKQKLVKFEVGNGHYATHKPKSLPTINRVRVHTRNGGVGFLYLPLRAGPAKVKGTKRNFGEPLVNLGSAVLTGNALGLGPASQTTAYEITSPDGQTVAFEVEAVVPDVAGETEGGDEAPVLSDAILVVPAEWVSIVTGDSPPPPLLRVESYQEVQIFDDTARIFATSGSLVVNNYLGEYSGLVGRLAVEISTGNGGPLTTRLTGITGGDDTGWEVSRGAGDFPRQLRCNVSDFTQSMQVPLGFEQTLDGYYLGTVVRYLAESGSIHPMFLGPTPYLNWDYVPPGTLPEAPYGPAGEDLPDDAFVLPRGFGNNPRYRILPAVSPYQALLSILADASYVDPSDGTQTPYYMGCTADGVFRFQPYDPTLAEVSVTYSSNFDFTGGVPIIGPISIYSSVAQMRSSIDFEGLDALSYDLLYLHLPIPDEVLEVLGYRYPWLERSPRFVSGDYMERLAENAWIQSQLPVTIARFQTVHIPDVVASQVVEVIDRDLPGGSLLMVITEILSTLDGTSGNAVSTITARALYNFL